MIQVVTNSKPNTVVNESEISNLDELVSRLSESYNLSSEKSASIRSGLENVITNYLASELTESLKPNTGNIFVIESVEDIDSDELLESIINSDDIVIRLNESNLINIQKSSEGLFTYTILEGVDVSKMDTEILIESWNSDSNKISDLLRDIQHAII